MDFDEIKQILEMMREHELIEFELERQDFKLRLRKNGGQGTIAPPLAPPATAAAPLPSAPGGGAAAPVLTAADDEIELAILKSPIVGTFYRSSEPGAPPYTEVGDTVKKGQVLCIIEAMKLMNEINADCDGEVVRIYVDSGQAVQYGERLFALKPL